MVSNDSDGHAERTAPPGDRPDHLPRAGEAGGVGRARRIPPAAVLRRGDGVGRRRGAAAAAAGSGCRGRGRARRTRRSHPHGRTRRAARAVRRGAASAHRPRATRSRRVGARAVPRRGGATDAGARDLPRTPARERRAGRHAAPAPARGARHRALPHRRRGLRDERGHRRRRLGARRARRRRARSTCTATTTRASTGSATDSSRRRAPTTDSCRPFESERRRLRRRGAVASRGERRGPPAVRRARGRGIRLRRTARQDLAQGGHERHLHRRQPGDRDGDRRDPAGEPRPRSTRRSHGPSSRSGAGRRSRRWPGPTRCASSPASSRLTSRSSRSSRCSTRGIRSSRPGGRPRTSRRCSTSTRARPSG